MITTALATLFLLAPFPQTPLDPYTPDPGDPSAPTLLPNYVTNGDGTRMQCTPALTYCWPDSTGLPSYLG